jgi:hypothetical protein
MKDNRDYQGENESTVGEDREYDPWIEKPWKYWSNEEREFTHWLDGVMDEASENEQWNFMLLVNKPGRLFGQAATREEIEELIEARVVGEIQLKDKQCQPIQLPSNLICEVIFGDMAGFVARSKALDSETQNRE